MKNKFRLLLIPSSVAFWVTLSSASISQLCLFCLFGIFTGFLVYILPIPRLHNKNRRTKAIIYTLSSILTISLCIECVKSFYLSWTDRNIFKKVITKLFVNYEMGLYIIFILISIAIVYFAFAISFRVIYYVTQMLRVIDIKSMKDYLSMNFKLNSIIKNLSISIGCIALSAVLGISLLTAVYCIPTDNINHNVAISAETIEEEGTYPTLSVWFHSMLDNWTDSVMMLTSVYDNTEMNELDEAVKVESGYIEDKNPAEILVSHYINGEAFSGFSEYCRYWHGYLVFLKPLFYFTNYSFIRAINGIVQILLMILLCWLLYKRNLSKYIIPLIITYLMLMPVAIAKSMQFSSCFYLFMISTLIIVYNKEHTNRLVSCVFLFTGILTAYFDFLTYPISTYGIPMILLLAIQDNKQIQLEEKLYGIFRNGVYWCLGYGGMWACKWFISYIITGYSFSEIFSVIAYRTSMSDEQKSFSLFNIEWQNYSDFISTPITLVALIVIAYFVIANKNKHYSANDNFYKIMLPYAIVGVCPVVWFAFASNHSAIHYWFTNKACSVTLLAALFFIVNVIIACEHTSSKSNNT